MLTCVGAKLAEHLGRLAGIDLRPAPCDQPVVARVLLVNQVPGGRIEMLADVCDGCLAESQGLVDYVTHYPIRDAKT